MKKYNKLKLAIDNKKDGILLARDVEYNNKVVKEFLVFKSYKEILPHLKNRNEPRHYYEVLLEDQPLHFFVDEDISDEAGRANPEQRIDNHSSIITDNLIEYCALQGIVVVKKDVKAIVLKSPSTEKKDSYHIIFRIKNVVFSNISVCKNFYEFMTITKKDILLSVDISVYNKNKCLRLCGSSKFEYPDNILKPIDTKVSELDTLASFVNMKEDSKKLNGVQIKKKVVKKKVIEEIEDFEDDENEFAQTLVEQLLFCLNGKRTYAEWHKLGILLYCIFNGSEDGKELFHKFGQEKSPANYSAQVIDDAWDGYKNLTEKRYTIGTLYYWAKQENIEQYKKVIQQITKNSYPSTHVAIANMFVNRFQNHIMVKDNEWYIFNDKHGKWNIENKLKGNVYLSFDTLIKEIKLSIPKVERPDTAFGDTAKDSLPTEDETKLEAKKKFKKWLIGKLETMSCLEPVISQIKIRLENKDYEHTFDKNANVFPFNNGVYDLTTKEFRVGYYEEFITKTCGYNYNKNASSANALEFLSDIIQDTEVRDYFLKIVASHLCGLHKREEFFVLYGKKGNNGKSTLMGILNLVFGLLFVSCKPEILTENKYSNPDGPCEELMSMCDKRIIVYNEGDKSKPISTRNVKVLTGGDKISGRNLFGNKKEFTIVGGHFYITNPLVQFSVIEPAIIRRLRCIEFTAEFVNEPCAERNGNERQIKDINKNDLRDSMVQLLIERYDADVPKGLDYIPESIKKTTLSYINETDNVRRFCNDYVVIDAAKESYLLMSELEILFNERNVVKEYDFRSLKFKQDFIPAFCNVLDTKLIKDSVVGQERVKNFFKGLKIAGANEGLIIKTEEVDDLDF